MPEGPEIKRAADEIAKAIAQQTVNDIYFAFEHLKPYESQLAGKVVTTVQSRGKAMLIHFENQLSIYSHNQLYGKWVIRKAYSYPDTSRQLRLAIHNQKKSALLYSASDIAVLTPEEVISHPFLSRLGPDLLDPFTTQQQVIERLQDPQFLRRRFTGLLLDQHFLCGLGNYLRSEVMFVAKIPPSLRPIDCSATQIVELAEAAIALTNQSYRHNGITNNLQVAQRLKAEGKRRREYRHWVFNRQGKPCFVCGTPIVKEILSGRRLYYCPYCQAIE
ncbi:MAG: endonuclease VIII [Elainellaceae cyanobacterium]